MFANSFLGASECNALDRTTYSLILKEAKQDTMRAMEIANSRKKETFAQQAQKMLQSFDVAAKQFNPLFQLISFVKQKIQDVTSECLICGSKQSVVLFKPTVCTHQLCNFTFLELGIGLDIESEIKFSSVVVDLLISLTWAGAFGKNLKFNFTCNQILTA